MASAPDASILSDEATGPGRPNFTGAFVGVVRICPAREGKPISPGSTPASVSFFPAR